MLPWLERASVVVAPLRTGGGTRLKVLEALAMGAALVATSEACSGLALVDEEHCLIREPTPEFANAVVRLLSDQPQRLRLGAQGRCMVEELYASRASGAEALQGYLAAIDLAKRPARQLVRARRMRDVNVA
jgi:glycosyltransferase involved in cell wall biosynthesis